MIRNLILTFVGFVSFSSAADGVCGPGDGTTSFHFNQPRASRPVSDPTRTHAIIYGGIYDSLTPENFAGFWNYVSLAYVSLLQSGVPKSQIRILWAGGPRRPGRLYRFTTTQRRDFLKRYPSQTRFSETYAANSDFDCDGENDIFAAATGPQLNAEIASVSQNLGNGDQLLLFLTGHGSGSTITAFEPQRRYHSIFSEDLRIKRDELDRTLDQVPNGVKTAVIIESCHGGGFLRLHRDNRCVVASSRESEVTWGRYSGYGNFASSFFSAVRGQELRATPDRLNIDLDRNGEVNLREAFEASRAYEIWRRTITPLYAQTPELSSDSFGRFLERHDSQLLVQQIIQRFRTQNQDSTRLGFNVNDSGEWQMRRGPGMVQSLLETALNSSRNACDHISF